MTENPIASVVVSGGASGIGRATAERLLEGGAHVAVLDLPAALAGDDLSGHDRCLPVACDVRDADEVRRAFDQADAVLPALTGAVCSAGIDRGGAAHALDDAVWASVIDTNLTGTFLVCREALSRLVARDAPGSIVCLSSPFAQVAPTANAAAYAASKGGIASLVRALAVEYARRGIRVNAVAPGPTETPLMWASVPEPEIPAMREAIADEVPAGRLAAAAEPAALIAWLLGPDAAYVTGAHIPCDGGVLARASITL